MKQKKGNAALMGLITAVLLLLVLGFVISISQNVMEDYGGTLTADTYAANATADSGAGLDKVSGFQGTIALVIVTSAIILILVGGLIGVFVGKRFM